MRWFDLEKGDVLYDPDSDDFVILLTSVETLLDGSKYALYYDILRGLRGQTSFFLQDPNMDSCRLVVLRRGEVLT